MERRRGRPPKQIASVVESVKEVNTTRDAFIKISLSMPNYPEVDDKVVIRDILGKVIGPKRQPQFLMQVIKDKLNDIS